MFRHPERRHARAAAHALVWASLAAALALTGCTGEPSTPSPSQTSAPASGSPAPIVTPSAAPVIVPGGTAEENLPVFSMVTAAVWASPQQVSGRAYVDALVTAGFDKSAMQVTYDESTVGDPAESIQFAVRWGDECLVGQVGPSTGSPVTVVVPALSEGTCLVGSTRPIDW